MLQAPSGKNVNSKSEGRSTKQRTSNPAVPVSNPRPLCLNLCQRTSENLCSGCHIVVGAFFKRVCSTLPCSSTSPRSAIGKRPHCLGLRSPYIVIAAMQYY